MISFKFKGLHFEGEELGDVCAPDSVPVLFGPARTPQENRQGREASPGRRSCVGRRGSFAVGHFGAGARIKAIAPCLNIRGLSGYPSSYNWDTNHTSSFIDKLDESN
jgi:hypothetical protein